MNEINRKDVIAMSNGAMLSARPSSGEAERFLGLKPGTLAEWVKRGHIKALSGPQIDGTHHYVFDRDTILNLREQPVSKRYALSAQRPEPLPTDVPPSGEDKDDLITAVKAAELLGIPLSQFGERYRTSERIKARARVGSTLLFSLSDVVQIRDNRVLYEESSEYLNADEAAALLGMKMRTFYRHVEQDLILPRLPAAHGYGARFHVEDLMKLKEFLQLTVSAREAMDILGTHPQGLYMLRKRGELKPAGPTKPNASGRYYRKDVLELLSARNAYHRHN